MSTELNGKRIAFLATDGVELVEEFAEGTHDEQRETTRAAVG